MCFALVASRGSGATHEPPRPPVLYTPLDEKPKRSGDPLRLARVRDVLADPRVSVLVDRWDEDWSRLAWLRLDGDATLLGPDDDDDDERDEHERAVIALRARYPQYRSHRLEERPLLRIVVTHAVGWRVAD